MCGGSEKGSTAVTLGGSDYVINNQCHAVTRAHVSAGIASPRNVCKRADVVVATPKMPRPLVNNLPRAHSLEPDLPHFTS